jgi:cbb3-type cytochrome oxidase maturation protein
MDSLYLLLPLSVLLVLILLAVLGWAVHRGQFEHLDQEGLRILEEDAPALEPLSQHDEKGTKHSA